MSKNKEVPIWEKYTLSVEEAAVYFCIGEGKLRQLIEDDKRAKYLLWNGNRYKSSESYLNDLLPCIRRELPVAGPVGGRIRGDLRAGKCRCNAWRIAK